MGTFKLNYQLLLKPFLLALAVLFTFMACSEDQNILQDNAISESETESAKASILNPETGHSFDGFDGPVFDIAALPNGGILVADHVVDDVKDGEGNVIEIINADAVIKEIGNRGVREITSHPMVIGSGAFGAPDNTFINGLEPIGNGNFFATRSGLDLGVGAALFRTTRGNERMVGDIESFTLGDWQEEGEGEPGQNPSWKNFECEPPGGFSAGPHTNPYHLTALSGSEVLIADAAGNSLLHATTNGNIEVVAYFPPVVDPDTQEQLVQFWIDDDGDMVLFNNNLEIECPVEPVPTAVAVGDDGAYYVGELTGTTNENWLGGPTPEGLASIWRVEAGSRDVNCPSDACTKVLTGLNSVIDIEFGPDGYLYLVEYEKNGFLGTVTDFGIPLAGGAVKKCDLDSDNCEIIEGGVSFEDLPIPGAITFDKWDNLWLLDNVFAPTVRTIDW